MKLKAFSFPRVPAAKRHQTAVTQTMLQRLYAEIRKVINANDDIENPSYESQLVFYENELVTI